MRVLQLSKLFGFFLFGLMHFGSVSSAQQPFDIQLATKNASADIREFYQARSYQPIWILNGNLSNRALELAQATGTLQQHGLQTSDYSNPEIESIFRGSLGSADALNSEVALTKYFLTVARHISVGRVEPSKVGTEIKYSLLPFTGVRDLAQQIGNYPISQLWNSVAPKNPHYQRIQAMLGRLNQIQQHGGFAPIKPSSSTLRLGVRAPIVRALKERALALGYTISLVDDNFDPELKAVIEIIQKNNLTKPTGVLGPKDAAWEFFSISSARRINQLELNLEKTRWLPSTLEPRHIFVNLATQRMQVVDPYLENPLLLDQNVVVGRIDRKTPSMREELEYVVFNPTWTVPPDIFRLDKIPAIQKAAAQGPAGVAAWFVQNRMSLLDRNEKPIDPTQFDWLNAPPKYGNVLIRQQPGTNNALGTMKFMMPNPYSIYLHDTNQPELLGSDLRMLSSGCIRLQYPRDFAEYLLRTTKWVRSEIDMFVVKPGETRDTESWVRLPGKVSVPVYIMSLTADLGAGGEMYFTRDIYKQNADLLMALKAAGYYR